MPSRKKRSSLRQQPYFANGFGHEALGILRMLMSDDPEMEKNPNIIALRGASAALAGHYDEAMTDLTNPAIQQHPEISLWIGSPSPPRRSNGAVRIRRFRAPTNCWLNIPLALPFHDHLYRLDRPCALAMPTARDNCLIRSTPCR